MQAVAARFQVPLDRLVSVELAVDDDVDLPVLACDGLIAGRQVDDAQPGVPETDVPVIRDPPPLPVGAAVSEPSRSRLDRLNGHPSLGCERRHDAAHPAALRSPE